MVEIRLSDQAVEELDSIVTYLATYSENGAKNTAMRIRFRIENLKKFPLLGRVLPELDYHHVREVIEGRYRIIYHVISDNKIAILSIHHSAMDFDVSKINPYPF